ncbi:hypothetical protein HDU96_005224 [Phlyctochytrium bullatum]|nr:hypothetical protein HDU96_005224 [Phlyctochytrium bullatum]
MEATYRAERPASIHEEIYGDGFHPAPRRVVCVAVDSSKYSAHALNWALNNLIHPAGDEGHEDQVVLLNCRPFTLPGPFFSNVGDIAGDFTSTPYDNPEWIDKVDEQGRIESHDLLKRYGAQVLSRNVACRAIALRGDPREEIAAKVRELKADVLVVGTRGMGTFKRAIFGSVSDYLLHHCDCTVIVPKMDESSKAVDADVLVQTEVKLN